MSGWGDQGWGISSWGGASLTTLTLLGAFAARENVVRLVFSMPVYFSTILDPFDGSNAHKFSIAIVPASADALGQPPRAVNIIAVERPDPTSTPPVLQGEVGFYLDAILDRPMSSFPALYDIMCAQLKNTRLTSTLVSATNRFPGVYRELQTPSLEMAIPARDFANPQTGAALAETGTDQLTTLASYVASANGDYAFDQGNTGRKKRVIRRMITSLGGFAHLPNYGLGLLERAKKLARPDQIGKLATDARLQLQREPDIAKVLVTADIGDKPNLLRIHVGIKPRGGQVQKFVVPVPIR